MRRFDSDKLVVATHNAGKLREISALLGPYGVAIGSAGDFGLDGPEETEQSFAGNARIKAHFAARSTGLPALSDDSGIMIDALDGQPGVYTADWAETGNGRDFMLAMTRAWDLLEEKHAPEPRRAKFCCTLCLAWPDGHDELFEGQVHGRLVWPVRGTRGFGYDPMFLPDGQAETFGQMAPERKHEISHRAVAFARLVAGCFA